MKIIWRFVAFALAAPLFAKPAATPALKPGRDAAQALDEEYTRKIHEYTTEPFFNSPLTDYLPASKTVPTPKAVLGDVAGAPGILRGSSWPEAAKTAESSSGRSSVSCMRKV
jgi:hypothetical protein